jgi:hypothetical protein
VRWSRLVHHSFLASIRSSALPVLVITLLFMAWDDVINP